MSCVGSFNVHNNGTLPRCLKHFLFDYLGYYFFQYSTSRLTHNIITFSSHFIYILSSEPEGCRFNPCSGAFHRGVCMLSQSLHGFSLCSAPPHTIQTHACRQLFFLSRCIPWMHGWKDRQTDGPSSTALQSSRTLKWSFGKAPPGLRESEGYRLHLDV